MKHALIFGVTGQDGAYLSELLLSKDYSVIGVNRRVSGDNTQKIAHIKSDAFKLVYGDVTDLSSVSRCINEAYYSARDCDTKNPLEIYNLAAQSQVRISFDMPLNTFDVTAGGAFNILEVIRGMPSGACKYYQASSSEQFGASKGTEVKPGVFMQDENTPMEPQSPYGVAKLAAHHMTKVYRSGYGLFACSGILFNHDGPRRGEQFLTRKVTKHVGKLHLQQKTHGKKSLHTMPSLLKLGNCEAYRDFGHAKDYVQAMWLMLQQDKPDDYVIATGEAHSIKEFVITAFQHALGYFEDSLIETDPNLFRAAEVNYLCGNSKKARTKLGWKPTVNFSDLVKEMVDADIKLAGEKNG